MWECRECHAKNAPKTHFCEACGQARALAEQPHKEVTRAPLPWERPGFKDSKPDDPCDEPGCKMTIREHIQQFKLAGEKIVARAVKL
jgi:hypothetical protein